MCKISYRRHRFPPIIIQHAVWLYCRFTLSYRDVEDLLAERGLDLSYETVRRWVLKFGRAYARRVQRRRPRPTERWHLDEMVVVIRGRRYFLWRAVDSEGEVLDFLIQSRRNTKAAIRLMRKLLKKQGFAPSTIVTDKLRSYGSAIRKLGLCAEHEQGLRKNNRAENLPSAGTTTRAKDAALQIAKVCPEIPRHPRCRLQSLQRPTPLDFPPDASPISHLSHGGMAGNNNGRLTNAIGESLSPAAIKVTVPIRCLKRFVARELYHLLPEPSLPLEPTSTPSPT